MSEQKAVYHNPQPKLCADCPEFVLDGGLGRVCNRLTAPFGDGCRLNIALPNGPEEPPRRDTDSQKAIVAECDAVRAMLLEKNRKYGDSALNPIRIMSRADAVEQINVRIDDKLSRIANRQDDEDEDVDLDLIGYLILRRIARRRA